MKTSFWPLCMGTIQERNDNLKSHKQPFPGPVMASGGRDEFKQGPWLGQVLLQKSIFLPCWSNPLPGPVGALRGKVWRQLLGQAGLNYFRKVSFTQGCSWWSWKCSPWASAQQRSFRPQLPPPKVKTLLFLCFYLGQRPVTVYKALGCLQGHSTRIPSLHKLSRT